MAAAELLTAPEGDIAPGVSMLESLEAMRRLGVQCDVAIVTSDGSQIRAHRAVLAASSRVFRERFVASGGDAELVLEATPEAVQLLVDFIYNAPGAEEQQPTAFDVIREVLVLAKQFEMSGLTQRAAEWLGKGVTTANVVEKLRACREFDLEALHARIVERLLSDRAALAQVSQSAEISSYPELMRALLQAAMSSRAEAAKEPLAEPADKTAGKALSEAAEPNAEDAEDVDAEAVADANPEGPAPKKRQRKGRGRGAA